MRHAKKPAIMTAVCLLLATAAPSNASGILGAAGLAVGERFDESYIERFDMFRWPNCHEEFENEYIDCRYTSLDGLSYVVFGPSVASIEVDLIGESSPILLGDTVFSYGDRISDVYTKITEGGFCDNMFEGPSGGIEIRPSILITGDQIVSTVDCHDAETDRVAYTSFYFSEEQGLVKIVEHGELDT